MENWQMGGELPVVAVIGAGNIGCALAAELGLRGAEVRLFNRSPGRLDPIREGGGITVTGALEGTAEVALLTSSLAEAVAGADVVAVTVPTPALPEYARPLGEAVTGDQVLWLDPGHSGGALYLAAEIERAAGRRDLKLCQLTTATHGARMSGPTTVHVFALGRPGLAAFPPAHLAECLARVGELLGGRVDALGTVLEADLLNLNALLHPPGMVCNAGWIEAAAGSFRFYAEGAGVSIGRVIDAVDAERLALAARLRVPTLPFSQMLHRMGFTTADAARSGSAHDALAGAVQIHGIPAPARLDHRYLHEDVGWGLVPWSQLAAATGVPTPVMSALISLAGTVNGLDYLSTGLTLERMGLAGMTADQMRAHVGGE